MSDENPVEQNNPPSIVQLLEIESLQLMLIQEQKSSLKDKDAIIQLRQSLIMKEISYRLGVDISKYQIDPVNRICKLLQKQSPMTPRVPAKQPIDIEKDAPNADT